MISLIVLSRQMSVYWGSTRRYLCSTKPIAPNEFSIRERIMSHFASAHQAGSGGIGRRARLRDVWGETAKMVLPLLKKAETQGTEPVKEYLKTAGEMAELLGISVRDGGVVSGKYP
jgi:hypothetical protein